MSTGHKPCAFTEHEVEAGGFTVRYFEAGSGEPLVMIHGGDGINLADEATLILSARYRVISVEMPGWGRSVNERTDSLRELGGTVAAAIDQLDLGPVRLIATSIGAPVALWAMLEGRLSVPAMVLESPAAFRLGGMRMRRAGGPDLASFNYQPAKKRDRQVSPRVIELMLRIAPPIDDAELAARLTASPTPILTLFGEHDKQFPPEIYADRYRDSPGGRVVVVAEAAHDLKGDRPEVFAELVTGFFDAGSDALPDYVA